MHVQIQEEFAAQHCFAVFAAVAMRVCSGVNHGDALSDIRDLCLGDNYNLQIGAATFGLDVVEKVGLRTTFETLTNDHVPAGIRVTITGKLTFMTQKGATVEALLLGFSDGPFRRALYPLGPIEPGIDYALIAADGPPDTLPQNRLGGMSFGRGTRITMADGSQRPVEHLTVGDRVLTRDRGMQPIRWLGTRTVQAAGAFAPVVISPGAMGNAEAIVIGQRHRMLISDWRAEVMVGSKDVLVQAKDLLKDEEVYLRSGGFAEYTQIVFDRHEVIYAEGVATESLALSRDALAALPADAMSEILSILPQDALEEPLFSRVPLSSQDAATLLRQTGRA